MDEIFETMRAKRITERDLTSFYGNFSEQP